MRISGTKTETWAATIENRPGGLHDKLAALCGVRFPFLKLKSNLVGFTRIWCDVVRYAERAANRGLGWMAPRGGFSRPAVLRSVKPSDFSLFTRTASRTVGVLPYCFGG